MTSTQPTAQDRYACAECGTWMHISREECPWCGAPNPTADEPTRTLNNGALAPNGNNGYTNTHGRLSGVNGVQTVALPGAGEMPTITLSDMPVSPVAEAGGRGRRFWVRAYSWTILLLLLALLGFGAAGVIQGLNDREVVSTTEAIAAYERGRELLDEGQYDLAIAYFQEALRQEPNFPAAEQMLALAETQLAAQQEGAAIPPTATPDPTEQFNADSTFITATTALDNEQWLAAADAFNEVKTRAPEYRPDEVNAGLFAAYQGLGEAALEEEDFENALRYFDEALKIRPDERLVADLRRLTSSYSTGLVAFERENWTQAADQFRTVYVLNPRFLEVADKLFQSHLALAEAFEEREIWCDAAQNYRAALTIEDDDAVAAKALAAERQCSVVAPPATRLPPTPEIVQDDFPTVEATPEISGTIAVTGTPDVRGTPVPIPTATRPAPTGFAFVPGPVTESLGEGCFGRYVLGTVRNSAGAPIPGVTLLLVDQYGNRVTAVSKDNPPGGYDLPINQSSPAYQLMVVAGDQVLSPGVNIVQSDAALASQVACYTVNWIQQ